MDKETNLRRKGKFYEAAVADYLKKKGYNIITQNYWTRFSEIDIIAEDKSKPLLIFIEVKARDVNKRVHPFEAVDERKQKKIILAAKQYMMENEINNVYVRFDVVGVMLDDDKIVKIDVLQDAFQA
ncbi:MAG TPA: YraN family protein [Candidatus Goldiibacteriota bacterium]|nr:YraN family protein [Candidatus Goldiibacteriota bacterium]